MFYFINKNKYKSNDINLLKRIIIDNSDNNNNH